jgi:peptidoglycan/LPS O-acetylase OafA/YrhL
MSQSNHLQFLDGLRGIAVLMVILSHLSNVGLHIFILDFSGIGKYGVYLFFVLSAFLLTSQFLQKGLHNGYTRYAISNYFFRRTLRIFPLYYLVIIVSAITTQTLSQKLAGHGLPFTIDANEVIDHLTLQKGNSVLWSIPVEFKFYFLLPLVSLAFILSRSRFSLDLLLVLFAILLTNLLYPASESPGNSVILGYYLPVFLLGSLSASATIKLKPRVDNSLALRLLVYILSIFSLALVPSVFSRIFFDIDVGYFHREFILFGFFWGTLIYALCHSSTAIKRALCWPPFTFLGRISFSAYLLHIPFVMVTRKFFPESSFAGLICFSVVLCASYVSFKVIEEPLSQFHLAQVFDLFTKRSAPSNE